MSGAVEGVALLPCPFCGGAPVTEVSGMSNDGMMISCMNSKCVGPHCSYIPPSAAVTAWNTRTTPPARSYADGVEFEEAATIADAFAAGQQRMIDEESPDEACRGGKEVAEFIANAIRRRAAIRLLSQGGKA